MRKHSLLFVGTAVIVSVIGIGASAQVEHPNLQRGIAPGKAYEAGDIDVVNLFNGNLMLTVPIGPTFHVNGSLSYGLTLFYNSHIWDYIWVAESDYVCHDPLFCDTGICRNGYGWDPISYPIARPTYWSNAGVGWTLSLGQLRPPYYNANDTANWVLTTPDGQLHHFYQTLHEDDDNEDNGHTAYTRDGTYLRLQNISSIVCTHSVTTPETTRTVAVAADVQSPDGTYQHWVTPQPQCTAAIRLDSIHDLDGNVVNVTYGASTWTLSDGFRTQTVNFRTAAPGVGQVDSVVLSAFGAGNTATYQFHYSDTQTCRSCKGRQIQERFACQVDDESATVSVPFLVGITLPDGSNYCMGSDCTNFANPDPSAFYNVLSDCGWGPTGQPTCNTSGEPDDVSGTIKKMQLPTGGTVAWTYQLWDNPSGTTDCVGDTSFFQVTTGVASRTLAGSSSGTLGTWTYTHNPPPTPPPDPALTEVTTTVTSPPAVPSGCGGIDCVGNDTVHYFTTQACQNPGGTGWDYGLPYTGQSSLSGLYKSVEFYQGPAPSPANLRRTTYVLYDRDTLRANPASMQVWYDSNRRVKSDMTVYNDDVVNGSAVYARTDRSVFDGFGHFRQTATSGAFGSSNMRTTFTDYNHDHGTYPPGTFTPWAVTAPWVLGTYNYTTQNEGGPTAWQEYCFVKDAAGNPTTGFLRAKRTRVSAGNGDTDLLVVFTPDSQGNVATEQYFGGDSGGASSITYCAAPWTTLSNDTYRIDHTYQYGTLKTSAYVGSGLNFYLLDADIDRNSGLVSTSRDSALIGTSYQYDGMGRVTMASPDQGHGACTLNVYYPWSGAGDTGAARVESYSYPNRSCSRIPLPSPLAGTALRFDGFGRLYLQKTLLGSTNASCTALPCWSQQYTQYDALGWKTGISEVQPGGTSSIKWTSYSSFDPFGRLGVISPPDGASHNVSMTYTGVRQAKRTVKVYTFDNTGANPAERAAETTETYDRQGRLWQLTEPSDSLSGNPVSVTTTYAYDVGNRLTFATTATSRNGTQARTFAYDLRGLLNSETLPELGPGTASYSKYDARGHAHCVQDGFHKLVLSYDRAERVIQVNQSDSNCNAMDPVLKTFTYANDNVTGDYRKGKLKTAVMTNPSTDGTTSVSETYTYGGVAGAVSQKATQIALTGSTSGDFGETFSQTFSWTDLGKLASQGYPWDATGGFPAATPRRSVYLGYSNGSLTSVQPYYATASDPNYENAIGYLANGMTSQVTHSKRVVDVSGGVAEKQEIDATSQMARPSRIYTSGAKVSGTGAAGDWSAGTYGYDGAGNMKAMGTDPLKTTTDTFVYDPVSRLVSAAIGGSGTQAYGYDPFGSMTKYNGATLPVLGTTNRLSGAGYDAAGNMTSWGVYGYAWDRFNQMAGMTGTNINRLLAYTTDGERIFTRDLLTTPPTYTITLRDLAGKVVRDMSATPSGGALAWTWKKDYVYRDGLLLASVSPTEGIRHYHLDHLGTPRMVTNRCGERYARFTYYPFGQEIGAPPEDGSERMRFTGHERDLHVLTNTTDDLDYMHARYYNPNLARFLATDPVRGDPESPQSWNMYAYVRNNPVASVDPSGKLVSPWHFVITAAVATAEGYGLTHALQLAWQDMWVDFETGSLSEQASETNVHAMIGVNIDQRPPTRQTQQEARQAIAQGVAKDLAEGTTRSIAHAEHTLKDFATPAHRDQVWARKLNLEIGVHILGDWFPSLQTLGNAVMNSVIVLRDARSPRSPQEGLLPGGSAVTLILTLPPDPGPSF